MEKPAPYALGLDIGANSVGWAVLESDAGNGAGLIAAGARVFEAGTEGDIATGRDQSRGVERRLARQQRRMTERRARRLKKIAGLLQRGGLLPDGNVADPASRDKLLAALDRKIMKRYAETVPEDDPSRARLPRLPYFLRARALDRPLDPHDLGRALYHLAQRRGFLSNRRESASEDEEKEEGEVKAGIAELERHTADAGARTLGEFFASLDPAQERIRQRWTSRQMYEDEFEAIWATQAPAHPDVLTPDLNKRLHKAIFHQRPLKSQKNLIGFCELEPGRRRAPWALFIAQRFRIVQNVNNLDVITPEGEIRPLTDEERSDLIGALDKQGSMTFGKIRTLLKLKGHKFNTELGGEKSLKGNTTAAKLIKVFEKRWDDISPEDRDRVVDDLRSIQKKETLEKRGRTAWGLDAEQAKQFAGIRLEPGYCNHSRQAIEKLLPLMDKGAHYATARKKLYGDEPPRKPTGQLPPLAEAFPELRNPVVARALNEVRKVVNHVVRQYGKPEVIRIELARDLKRSRSDRKDITRRNQENRKGRERAAEKILAETAIREPSRADIEKVVLAEECGWQCPYTGRTINMAGLVGDAPQFDVEHIIPFQRWLDNSFLNKTLCHHEENRNVKKGRTPFEAYGSNPERWAEILQRVKKFKGKAAGKKLRRFALEEVESIDDFASRQLNDTRYASRLAADYVGLLYGGRTDPDGKLRVQPSRGQVTHFLRDEWGLNAILGDGGLKTRDDHRHHAVDAVVTALATPAVIKRLSDAAGRASRERRKRFGKVDPPWSGFLDDVRRAVEAIHVSHRPDRKVSGALHEETIYSPPVEETDERGTVHLVHHVRKPLDGLSKKALNQIVDGHVRELVLAKLRELGGGDPKKLFADPASHPRITIKRGPRKGQTIPIHTVRIRVPERAKKIGKGHRARHVLTGSNHHVEVLEVKDKRGCVKWDGEIVTRYEALRRTQRGEPVVTRDHGPDKKFLFSLCNGDTIQMDDRTILVIRSMWQEKGSIRFTLVDNNDARKLQEARLRMNLNQLRQRGAQKVTVTPLGDLRRASD